MAPLSSQQLSADADPACQLEPLAELGSPSSLGRWLRGWASWPIIGGAAVVATAVVVAVVLLPMSRPPGSKSNGPPQQAGVPVSETDGGGERLAERKRGPNKPGFDWRRPAFSPSGESAPSSRPSIRVPDLESLTGSSSGPGSPLRWANSAWAVAVPPSQRPRIDGVSCWLPGEAKSGEPWILVLPPGAHVVQTDVGTASNLRKTAGGFPSHYQNEAKKYQDAKTYIYAKLLKATLPKMGVFEEPLLPHFWGNYFWQEGKPRAAIRYWQWAVRQAPTFAPAHLNLAYAYYERGSMDRARQELRLALALNVQDAYGIERHLRQLQEERQVDGKALAKPPSFDPSHYDLEQETLSAAQRRVVDAILLVTVSAGGKDVEARALNNTGVYLGERAGRPQAALHHLRRAAESLAAQAVSDRDRPLVRQVLSNLAAAMGRLKMAEQRIYADLAQAQP